MTDLLKDSTMRRLWEGTMILVLVMIWPLVNLVEWVQELLGLDQG